jgi:hypothetical protein
MTVKVILIYLVKMFDFTKILFRNLLLLLFQL